MGGGGGGGGRCEMRDKNARCEIKNVRCEIGNDEPAILLA